VGKKGDLKIKTDMLRSIGKQSGESMYLNKLTTCHIKPEEEKKATVGRICRKGRF